MKIPEKWKCGVKSFWQGAALVLGGLLALDFLVCLIAALVSLNWLLNQVELIVVTAALLLVGILVYLPAKRIGVQKLPRLLLGFGLLGGGLVLVFFVVMYAAAFFSMMEYIRHIKADDPG
ncbi:hypothetical protein D5272_05660 [bacterium D16-76]|nr:hypothetical protein [bacterium D16-76]